MQQENVVCKRGVLCFYAVYQFVCMCVRAVGSACVCACMRPRVWVFLSSRRGARRTEPARSAAPADSRVPNAARLPRPYRVEPRLAIPTLCTGNFSKQFRADSIVARHCRFEFRAATWSTPFVRLYVHCSAFMRLCRSIFEYSLNASRRSFRNAARRSRVNGLSVCTPASRLLCFCWRITFCAVNFDRWIRETLSVSMTPVDLRYSLSVHPFAFVL